MEIEREELQPGTEEAGISGAEQDEIDKEKQSTTEERTGEVESS
jgi:hypothetical protein